MSKWNNFNNPYCNEIVTAINQLDVLVERQDALRHIDNNNFYIEVKEDVENFMLSNMDKIINRMVIVVPLDKNGRFPIQKNSYEYTSPADGLVDIAVRHNNKTLKKALKFLRLSSDSEIKKREDDIMHRTYLSRILKQNALLLDQYKSLLLEISQVGYSPSLESINLKAMTEALRDFRMENE